MITGSAGDEAPVKYVIPSRPEAANMLLLTLSLLNGRLSSIK